MTAGRRFPEKAQESALLGVSNSMFNAIVAVFIVFGIFSIIASLFTLYVWHADPNQFAIWKSTLRARWNGRSEPAP